MGEQETVQSVRATLSRGRTRLFRNNVGKLKDRNGQWVQYGLTIGSSDLIGWQTLTVTTDMIGRKIAVFVALEGKSKTGATTEEQRAFIKAVEDAGGIAGVFRSVGEAANILEGVE